MFARKFLGGWIMVAAILTLSAGVIEAQLKRSDSKVKIDARSDKPGNAGAQTVTVTLDVEDSWYVYANPVGNETLEPAKTEVKVLGKTGELDAKIAYPAGTPKQTGTDAYQVYQGKVTIPVQVVRPDAEPLTVSITVSACQQTKAGTGLCLLPATVKVNVP